MYTGDFLPISRDRISATFPIKNSHLFSQYVFLLNEIKKWKTKQNKTSYRFVEVV